ncbi:MAG: adenylate/guanylate cyclase domain-containing protein [Acidimicrobiia bacterium]
MDEARTQLPSGTVTFLFSDIEGSTGLTQELDVSTYRELIEQHHRLLRSAFGVHGGVERGTQGDAFLVVFRDAPSAIAAAVDAQRSLAAATWPAGARVRVRMGIHSGTGIHGGDDYIGLDINRAARIASAAHGGQVLISDSTRGLSERTLPKGVAMRDVGEHRLKGLDLTERLYQLTIEGLDSEFPLLRTLQVGKDHLPARMTSFVGRRAHLDELQGLLRRSRLVTLVGPGGTGKTSLAVELAREAASGFADGAWFVDLAPLTDPAVVGPTVARSLGLSEQPDRPIFDLLKIHLAKLELLMILDNFEHLLAASDVVEAMLASASGLKLLITSRSILNLYGEQEFAVPPLALPEPGAGTDVDDLTKYEAVELFIDRARLAKPGFRMTSENAATVAEICFRLDGLPLAIELAASRVRLMGAREILSRIDQRLPVLAAGASNVPARQRTLSGAIAWSYELLRPAEQGLFARLSIFAGGCTIETAEAICNPGGALGIDTFEGIASLVSQSLVGQRSDSGDWRFTILETIREYGRDRLSADGLLDEIGQRHLFYFRDLAEQAEPHLLGVSQAGWLDRLEREHDNVRDALRRALDTRDAESGMRLSAALWRFWFQRGYLREGRSWLEELQALDPDSVSVARAKAFTALGGLAYWLTDTETTELAYESALSIYRQLGDRNAVAEALYNLAFVPEMRQDPEEGRRRFQANLALAREIGNPHLAARNQLSLAVAAVNAADLHQAVRYSEEALTFFRAAGDHFHMSWALGLLGEAYRLRGDLQAGQQAYQEALRVVTDVRDLPLIGATLEQVSALESSVGRHIEAIHLLGAAVRLRETTGASLPQAALTRRQVEDVARQTIGSEAVEKALAEGRKMTLEEAIEYATRLLAD